jgi:hypothetical protein
MKRALSTGPSAMFSPAAASGPGSNVTNDQGSLSAEPTGSTWTRCMEPSVTKEPTVGHACVGLFAVLHHAGQTFRTTVVPLRFIGKKWSSSYDEASWVEPAVNTPQSYVMDPTGRAFPKVLNRFGTTDDSRLTRDSLPPSFYGAMKGDTSVRDGCPFYPLEQPFLNSLPCLDRWETFAGNEVTFPVLHPECPVDVALYELRKVTCYASDRCSCGGPTGCATAPSSPRGDSRSMPEVPGRFVPHEYYLPVMVGQHSIPLVRDDFADAEPVKAGTGLLNRRRSTVGRRRSQVRIVSGGGSSPVAVGSGHSLGRKDSVDSALVDDAMEDSVDALWESGKLLHAGGSRLWCDLMSPAVDRPSAWVRWAGDDSGQGHASPACLFVSIHHHKGFPVLGDAIAPSGNDVASVRLAKLASNDVLEHSTIIRGDELFRRTIRLEVAPCKLFIWGDLGAHLAVVSTTSPLRLLSGMWLVSLSTMVKKLLP